MMSERLDIFIARTYRLSRHQAKKIIEKGLVTVRGKIVKKPSQGLTDFSSIQVDLPSQGAQALSGENIPLNILYEDGEILVIDKPAGMVVHPGAGHASGTLVNALLAHCGSLPQGSEANKPGIVHRLDKGTSGVMVVAKTDRTMANLQKQFKDRKVEKKYLTLVFGKLPKEGKIDSPIGRHPKKREKMSSHSRKGKEAVTEWKVLETFTHCAFVEIKLHTGRTHQIRVHLTERGNPLVGDPTYGRMRKRVEEIKNKELRGIIKGLKRPMLHAHSLGFYHPESVKWMTFQVDFPEDMNTLLIQMRNLDVPT